MKNDSLDLTWAAPANAVAPAELERLRLVFQERLHQARRRLILVLGGSGMILVALTAVFLQAFMKGDQALGWAGPLLLLPPWTAFVLFARRHLIARAKVDDRGTIQATIAAALDETQAGLARARTVAVLHVVSLPLLIFAARELVATGKVAAHELPSVVLVLAILVGGTGVVLAYHYFLRLMPRRRHLENLLASYAS